MFLLPCQICSGLKVCFFGLTLRQDLALVECAAHCVPLMLHCIPKVDACHCRWEKSGAEAELMQASASATAAAMTECMQLTRPGVQEHQLAAVFGELLCLLQLANVVCRNCAFARHSYCPACRLALAMPSYSASARCSYCAFDVQHALGTCSYHAFTMCS